MDPAGELVRLASDVSETFGLYPEHMDRLVLIGHDINRIYRPTLDFMIALREFEDYFERWGVCSDVFWSFHAKCCEVSGLTPQDAMIVDEPDRGDPEVNSILV